MIYDIVLTDIRRNLFQYRFDGKKFTEFLGSRYRTMTDKTIKRLETEYGEKQRRCDELNRILCKLYEDNALGKIPDSRYEIMTVEYEAEQAEIRKKLLDLAILLDELKRGADSTAKFTNVNPPVHRCGKARRGDTQRAD